MGGVGKIDQEATLVCSKHVSHSFVCFPSNNIGELVTLQEQGFFFFLRLRFKKKHGIKAFKHIYHRDLLFLIAIRWLRFIFICFFNHEDQLTLTAHIPKIKAIKSLEF